MGCGRSPSSHLRARSRPEPSTHSRASQRSPARTSSGFTSTGRTALRQRWSSPRFNGLEHADSISLDAHKWLYQPLDCSLLLYRDPVIARTTFAYTGDYAKTLSEDPVEGFAFFEESVELSRRFRALKLWLSLRYHGLATFRAAIEENLRLARLLAQTGRAGTLARAPRARRAKRGLLPLDERRRRHTQRPQRRDPPPHGGTGKRGAFERDRTRPLRPPSVHRQLPDNTKRRRGNRARGAQRRPRARSRPHRGTQGHS
jgi:hypothetical protein